VIDVPEHLSKRTKLATAQVALTGLLILAPTAHADPTDDMNYIQKLYEFGITRQSMGASPEEFLSLGHAVCQHLANGQDPNGMASHIEQARPNLTQMQAQMLISASVVNYCPNVLPKSLPWSPQQ